MTREERNARQREYYRHNRDKFYAAQKRWKAKVAEARPDVLKAMTFLANSLKRESAYLLAKVFERDGNACLCCGATDDLTLDHVVPLAKGGTTTLNNLQVLCRSCNAAKGGQTIRYGQEGLFYCGSL